MYRVAITTIDNPPPYVWVGESSNIKLAAWTAYQRYTRDVDHIPVYYGRFDVTWTLYKDNTPFYVPDWTIAEIKEFCHIRYWRGRR